MIHVTSCSALKFETMTGSAVAIMVWSRAISATLNKSAKTRRRRGFPDSRRLSSMLATIRKVSGVGGQNVSGASFLFSMFMYHPKQVTCLPECSHVKGGQVTTCTAGIWESKAVSAEPLSRSERHLGQSTTRRITGIGTRGDSTRTIYYPDNYLACESQMLPRMSARPHANCSSVIHSPYIAAPSLFP